jgi:hypothetical protein
MNLNHWRNQNCTIWEISSHLTLILSQVYSPMHYATYVKLGIYVLLFARHNHYRTGKMSSFSIDISTKTNTHIVITI